MTWFTPEIEKMLYALLLGGLIGAEREYRSKSAGLRTMILVCTGSCLFTILSIAIGTANPDRVAANIITGIGFLGAGVIFKDNNNVNGITTATAIWMVAALGMSIGGGYIYLAFMSTFIVLIVLIGLRYIQNFIDKANRLRNYKIVYDAVENDLMKYEKLFKEYNLVALTSKTQKVGSQVTFFWLLRGTTKNHDAFIAILLKDPVIQELEF
ncbi:MgtC/SapB family protein [Danxiaibacter flavus]|uniref:MgtC/SapB family protein n=1 Tax=Danxiaibacter flavus TaxID=3049108 RepID=A0ABV3ZQM2_9BACT|nr:MgtC/SapB family protein [Chitinophagaceae bacterium DXS]